MSSLLKHKGKIYAIFAWNNKKKNYNYFMLYKTQSSISTFNIYDDEDIGTFIFTPIEF